MVITVIIILHYIKKLIFKKTVLLRLRESQNVTASCDCQPYPKYRGIRSKKYFTDNRNTIHGFRDSVLVLKIHGCYLDTQKFEQLSIPIQVIEGDCSVLM